MHLPGADSTSAEAHWREGQEIPVPELIEWLLNCLKQTLQRYLSGQVPTMKGGFLDGHLGPVTWEDFCCLAQCYSAVRYMLPAG